MPPTLLLIRHAQALHNVASDWSIRDAPLSELGEQQCLELQESLKGSEISSQVELIVVSAMRRTLQTASLGLDFLIKRGIPVAPDAMWQENSDKPCDTGSSLSIMEKEFPSFDFSNVDPSYPDKTSNLSTNPYAFTEKAILARGQTCLKNLYTRPEKVIAVVSHSGFLRTAVSNRKYANADWRIFNFDEEAMKQNPGSYKLKEWEETERKGGALGRSEVGVFFINERDFPPAVKEFIAKAEPQVHTVDEVAQEKP